MKYRVILINIIALILLAELCGWLMFTFEMNKVRENVDEIYNPKIHFRVGNILLPFYPKRESPVEEYNSMNMPKRPVAGLEFLNKKPSIVVFGCSFAYGEHLEDNQIFTHKLAQATKRTVYNRAFSGWSAQHMLYQLRNEPLLDEIQAPEYVIYVFIPDHYYRTINGLWLDNVLLENYILYRRGKNNSLVLKEQSLPVIGQSFFLKSVAFKLNNYQILSGSRRADDVFKLHLKESQKLIKEKWPDAKPVILKYYAYQNPSWQELEDDGWTILGVEDDFGIPVRTEEFCLSYDVEPVPLEVRHANEKAWDTVTALLVKKLGL